MEALDIPRMTRSLKSNEPLKLRKPNPSDRQQSRIGVRHEGGAGAVGAVVAVLVVLIFALSLVVL